MSIALWCRPAGSHEASAPQDKRAPQLCDGLPPIEVLFRFGTGAPAAAPPAFAADGSIYVGTTDGYVHALTDEGTYRWSYTLAGPVVGRAAIGAAGTLLVPTSRRIYAIRPEGTLLWVFASPVPVRSDLVRDGSGRYHFLSDEGRLFALSGRGALVSHVPGSSSFSAGPVALEDGAIAAGRANGRVIVVRPGKNEHFDVGDSVSAVLACSNIGGLCVVAGGVLRELGSGSNGFRTKATRAAANAGLLAVISGDSELQLFRDPGGERLFSMLLPEAASGSPVVDPRGRVFVGLRSGTLLGISSSGRILGCVSLGHSAVGTPVLDALRRRLLVTLSQGLLVAASTS